ncbi:GAF domain-containing sensor histidine kinase [Bdellovibrionota bacterium FG-2]
MKRIKLFRILLEETAHLGSLDEVCQAVLRHLPMPVGFSMAVLSVYDPERDVLVVKASKGLPEVMARGPTEFAASWLLSGSASKNGEALIVRDLEREFGSKLRFAKEFGIKTFVCVPIVFHKKMLGVLGFANQEPVEFEDSELAWYEDVAAFASCLLEQKKANEDLRVAEARLNEAQRLAAVGSWERNIKTNASTWSAETYRILGVDPSLPPLFETFLSRVHPDDRGVLNEALANALEKDIPYNLDFRTKSLEGIERILNSRAQLKRDSLGNPTALLGTIQDITARKAIEREKDFFLATLSHELRTPLTAIMAWADLLADKMLDPKTFEKGIALVQKSARTQARLIEDLLDVSRIISGKISLDLRKVSLDPFLEALSGTFSPLMKPKEINWECRSVVKGLEVTADPARVQQILSNLINNALKFTPPGGSITLFTRENLGRIEIRVRDTGDGIPADFLPRIFQRFSQADTSFTKKHGGLGLGLAICQGLVEMMGGAIRAESPGPGKGATFTVELPKA